MNDVVHLWSDDIRNGFLGIGRLRSASFVNDSAILGDKAIGGQPSKAVRPHLVWLAAAVLVGFSTDWCRRFPISEPGAQTQANISCPACRVEAVGSVRTVCL